MLEGTDRLGPKGPTHLVRRGSQTDNRDCPLAVVLVAHPYPGFLSITLSALSGFNGAVAAVRGYTPINNPDKSNTLCK